MLLVIIFLIIFIIAGINIKIHININSKQANCFVCLYIFKVPVFKRRIAKGSKFIKGIKSVNSQKTKMKDIISILKNVKKDIKLHLQKFDLSIDVSTAYAVLTSYAVFVISNIITFALRFFKINVSKCKYSIKPLYLNYSKLNIKFNCIISVNLVHITYIVFKNFMKWRSGAHGRKTSHRESYDNCYE